MNQEMFNNKEVSGLSAREKWKQKHDLIVTPGLEGFTCRSRGTLKVGAGNSEEEALVDWAIKSKKPDWRESRL